MNPLTTTRTPNAPSKTVLLRRTALAALAAFALPLGTALGDDVSIQGMTFTGNGDAPIAGSNTLTAGASVTPVSSDTPSAHRGATVQPVGPLVLENSTVRSTLTYSNAHSGGTSEGPLLLNGTETIGGDVQLGTSAPGIALFGENGGALDTLIFTGHVSGGLIQNLTGATIDFSQAVTRLGFSPAFVQSTGNQIFSNLTFEVDTNQPFLPGAPSSGPGLPNVNVIPAAGTENATYATIISHGFENDNTKAQTFANTVIAAHSDGDFTFDFSAFAGNGGTVNPGTTFQIARTDSHMWPTHTQSGFGAATYTMLDSTIVYNQAFTNTSIDTSTMPNLGAGESYEVSATDRWITVYVQGAGESVGSGGWVNANNDSLWSTNSATNSNWAGGHPILPGHIATFSTGVTAGNHNGGAVVNDLFDLQIGGIVLEDSTVAGGYNLSGNSITLRNASVAAGVVTYTDPTIDVNSGTHTIANDLVIGNGDAGAANGLVVTTAPGSQLTIGGNITSGFTVGTDLTKAGAGDLTLSGANTFNGALNVNAGTLAATGGAAIPDTAAVNMDGGRLLIDGFSETAGVFKLMSNSIIDFGGTNNSSAITFADSSAETWLGTLSIHNYSAADTGGGVDQLFYGMDDSTGLTGAQLARIQFYSDAGITPLGGGAMFVPMGMGEVTYLIPEPGTVSLLLLVFSGALLRRRR